MIRQSVTFGKRERAIRRAGWRLLGGCAGLAVLAGCATLPTPRNARDSAWQSQQLHAPYAVDALYQPQQRQAASEQVSQCHQPAAPAALVGLNEVPAAALEALPDLLTPGDRVKLDIAGDQDQLTGTYVVGANGQMTVTPGIEVSAAGRTRADVAYELRQRLIATGQIRDVPGNLQLRLAETGGVSVAVDGAVFQPGEVRVGERSDPSRATVVDHPAGGDFNVSRSLSSALRAAGGIRPDASTRAVYLIRGGTFAAIDLSPAVAGGIAPDPQLISGDRIIVLSAGCFQPALARVTSVTAPGIRVYMSNLTHPAMDNAGSAIGRDSTNLPYGVRFLQGLVSANCVGGSMLNAQRHAVLISRNPVTGRSVVVQRSIEQLVRNANRDELDPWLMPDDAIACYDSAATSIAEVVGVLGSAATPAALVKGLTN